MKILMVSNFYPPHYRGGYEVRCKQVAETMQQRGHEVRVLTSVYGLPMDFSGGFHRATEEIEGVRVDRWLDIYAYGPQPPSRPWTLVHARRQLADARRFAKILSGFKPDIVNWWSMNGLSMNLLPMPAEKHIPDIHWIEHPWMINEYGVAGEKVAPFWEGLWDGSWGAKPIQPLLRWFGRRWERQIASEGIPTRQFPNQPRHMVFVSEFLRTLYRDAGLTFLSSEVIFGGVPIDHFLAPVRRHGMEGPIRLLYAGQITLDRGLHTAVEAFGQVPPQLRSRLTLSIAGDNPGEYLDGIRRRVQELGLTEAVTFLGKVPHDRMPEVYKCHDILVFVSTREEGLPLVMVEAMLAGCAVLTTGSGGAIEVAKLADLPLIPKADSGTLARRLTEFISNPAVLDDVALRGQEVARKEFGLDVMIQRWESTIAEVKRSPINPRGECR
ncbi:glycosyltransferase family 4 protein [Nitrospira lenta]|nr:glycosyltransferase family 4 protein [Nitrospira lenta]